MNIDCSKWREISVEEHKQRALQILLDVAQFCEENNIRYYLAYGTLIGAVRHKGFIPWDDDIDIQMPRPDYEKFADMFNSSAYAEKYRAVMPADKGAIHTFMKVFDLNSLKIEKAVDYKKCDALGIDIDIFPIDGLYADDEKYRKAFDDKLKLYARYVKVNSQFYTADLKATPVCALKYVKRLVPHLKTKLYSAVNKEWKKDWLLAQMHAKETEIPFESADMVGSNCSLYDYFDDRYPKKCYETAVKVEFEGYQLNAPAGYDTILTKQYGDYMTPPPADKQITHHGNKVYVRK